MGELDGLFVGGGEVGRGYVRRGREHGDLECWKDVGNVGELEGLSIGGKGGSVGREGWDGWILGEVKGLG